MKDNMTPKEFAQRCRIVGMTFLNLHEQWKGIAEVNMNEPHVCGTVACHGGWWAIDQGTEGDYEDGAESIARFLGFLSYFDLEDWAHEHPDLWGNENGWSMFCDESAFDCTDENITLWKIGVHWLKVAERVEEI